MGREHAERNQRRRNLYNRFLFVTTIIMYSTDFFFPKTYEKKYLANYFIWCNTR